MYILEIQEPGWNAQWASGRSRNQAGKPSGPQGDPRNQAGSPAGHREIQEPGREVGVLSGG